MKPETTKWDIACYYTGESHFDSSKLEKFIDEGWEPFSVDQGRIYFKKMRENKDD